MKIKLLILNLFFLFTYYNSISQSPGWMWAKGFGSWADDWGNTVAVDASGNVYISGTFEDTVDFDGGLDTFNVIAKNTSIYIEKLNSNGDFIWVKTINATPGNIMDNPSISVSTNGNIYLTGSLLGTADFDPGSSVYTLSANVSGIFYLGLNSNGDFLWAKLIDDVGYIHPAITLKDSYIYSISSYQGTIDFDPGPGIYSLTSDSNYFISVYILKLDLSGNFIWAKSLDGRGSNYGYSITADEFNSVNITGTFTKYMDFDPGAGTYFLYADTNPGWKGFVASYDSAGNFKWADAINGNSIIAANDIAVDKNGSVYSAGRFDGTVDFNPDSLSTSILTNNSGAGYILKLDSAGDFVWVKEFSPSGGSTCEVFSIAVDSLNNIYTTGRFSHTVDFDPGSNTINLSSVTSGYEDIFVSKLDENGNFVWAVKAGGIRWEYGQAIAVTDSGNAIVCGNYINDTVHFGSTYLPYFSNPSSNKSDIFVAKLSNLPVGINDFLYEPELKIIPNPAVDMASIYLPEISKQINIKLYDISGKLIDQFNKVHDDRIQIETKNMNAGLYILEVISEKYFISKRLVIIK